MKKILLLFVLILMLTGLPALDMEAYSTYDGVFNRPFRPAGLEKNDRLNYSLFGNASLLQDNKLRIQALNFDSTSFNAIYAMTRNERIAESMSNFTKLRFQQDDILMYLLGLVLAAGEGYNDIINADAGIGAQIGNFGVGINLLFNFMSKPGTDAPVESIAGNGFLPMLDYALTVAYGRRLVSTENFTLDLGLAVRYAEKLFFKQVTVTSVPVILSYSNPVDYVRDIDTELGFAIPIDAGVTFGFYNEHIKLGVSVNNIDGIYHMQTYSGYENALKRTGIKNRYEIETPFLVNASLMLDFYNGIVNPYLSFDFSGINTYFADKDENQNKLDIVRHFDFEFGLDIYSILYARVNFRGGYPVFAAGLSFHGNRIELSYGFKEGGTVYSQRPVDELTIKVCLGYE